MKKTSVTTLMLLPLLGIALTGCSFMNKIESGLDSITGNNKKVQTEVVLPNDREQIHVNATAKTYTPEELAKGAVTGDWAIETVDGKEAVGESVPFIKFVPSEQRIYGNDGCNIINGGYTSNPADSTIQFSNLASTMMACGLAGITDREISIALDKARYYSWKLDESEYYLYLYDENHREVMSLMHQNFSFLDGTWRVTAIDDEPVNVEGMKLVIDTTEGKIHGNTGCNIINGSLELDMETPNSISFQKIGMTRRACPQPNYEMQLIVALEDACRAKPISKDKVVLLNSQKQSVIQLERTSDSD